MGVVVGAEGRATSSDTRSAAGSFLSVRRIGALRPGLGSGGWLGTGPVCAQAQLIAQFLCGPAPQDTHGGWTGQVRGLA